jgi:hypothetical protein
LNAEQPLKGLDVPSLAGVGPVNEQQVQVVEPEALQAGLAGLAYAFDAVNSESRGSALRAMASPTPVSVS